MSTKTKNPVHKTTKLILKGNPVYLNRMFLHLRKEHPSVRRRLSKV